MFELHVRFKRHSVIYIAAVLLVPWIILGSFKSYSFFSAHIRESVGRGKSVVHEGRTGLWGKFLYTDVIIGLPDEFVALRRRIPCGSVRTCSNRSSQRAISDSIAMLRKLLYRVPGSSMFFFADTAVALRQLPDNPERRLFVKMLASKPTLLVRLQIDDNSDIEALAAYWGRGGGTRMSSPSCSPSKEWNTGGTYAARYPGEGSLHFVYFRKMTL